MDDQPIPGIIHFQLASQSTVVFPLVRCVQHAVFHIVHLRHLIQPGFVDIGMTRRAGARATALGDNPIYVVIDRSEYLLKSVPKI